MFKDNTPSRKFASSFLKRHKERLALRLYQNMKRARAGVPQSVIQDYFSHLEKELVGVEPQNILKL